MVLMKIFKFSDKEFLKSSGIVGIGNVVARGFGFVFLIIIARVFSTQDYGIIRYSITVATIASIPLFYGFPTTLSRYLAKYDDKNTRNSYFSNAIFAISIILTITIIIITLISFFIEGIDIFITIIIVGYAVNTTYFEIVRGLLLPKRIMIYKISVGAVKISLVLLLIYIIKINSTDLVLVIFGISSFMFILIEVFKPIKLKFKIKLISKKRLSELTKFAIPLMITTAAYHIIFGIDILFIKYYEGIDEVGYYGVARTLSSVFYFVPVAIVTMLIPIVSKSDKKLYLGYTKLSIKLTLFASLVLLVLFFLFGEFAIKTIFAERYLEGLDALYVLCIGMSMFSLYIILEALVVGIGKPEFDAKSMVGTMVINIVGNICLVPKYGMIGAGVAFVIGVGFGLGLLGFYTIRYLKRKEVK